MESTSDHTLNADLGLNLADRLRWLWLNWRNNARPQSEVDPALSQRVFPAHLHLQHLDSIDPLHSPPRQLCDLFWLALSWEQIARAFPGPLRLLEIGCGSGRYGTLLASRLGKNFGAYTGIDIKPKPEWGSLPFRFEVAGAGDVGRYLADCDVLFTQSAIEHFEGDLAFMRIAASHVRQRKTPFMQVHLMPSAACLGTFLCHGVRNYTPRTISHLTRLFGEETQRVLYSLGSAHCNRVHRGCITYPSVLRMGDRRRAHMYRAQVHEAIERDSRSPRPGEACFYALVLMNGVPYPLL
jgi:SAM-dependent methyltransferase